MDPGPPFAKHKMPLPLAAGAHALAALPPHVSRASPSISVSKLELPLHTIPSHHIPGAKQSAVWTGQELELNLCPDCPALHVVGMAPMNPLFLP